MKVIGLMAIAALLVVPAGAPAQTTASKPATQPANKTPPKPVTSGPSLARGGTESVTLTGCLTATSGEPKGYQLAVSSVAPGATTPTITNYQLVAIPEAANAAGHVGHRVTVSGFKIGQATAARGARGAAAGTARGARGAAASQPVQVRVKEIAMVADSCK